VLNISNDGRDLTRSDMYALQTVKQLFREERHGFD
jgi:hypothetical protein